MNYFKLDYSEFLCSNILMLDDELSSMFYEYKYNNKPNFNLDFTYHNNELNQLLLETIKQINSYKYLGIGDYYTLIKNKYLSIILEYINNIKYLYDKCSSLRDAKYYKLEEIHDYQFCDSRLTKLELNNQEHNCKCFFTNVLIYGDKRVEKIDEGECGNVECGNVVLEFTNVTEVKIDGVINQHDYKTNNVKNWMVEKVSDTSNCFSLLCNVGYEKLIIEILFSNVTSMRADL